MNLLACVNYFAIFTGAIGKDAMLENGRLNPSTNLQVGTVTLRLYHPHCVIYVLTTSSCW